MRDTDVAELLDLLSSRPETALRFALNDMSINPGYHVTEIKHARIKSMDCAGRAEEWEEIVIQLLDGDADSPKGYMSTTKFTGIVSSTLRSLTESSTPMLFFEFTPNNGPLQKLTIKSIERSSHEVSIHLAYVKAACKPFQRWGKAGAVIEKISKDVTKLGCCSGRAACCG